MSDAMNLLPLIAGMTAQDLWSLNNLSLPAWLLLALFPRWKYTPTLTLIPPLIHAAIYTVSIVNLMLSSDDEQADFMTLKGVVEMFANPNVVFIGWVHYIAFDLLVGRGICMDSVSRGASTVFHVLVVIPSLFLTLMAGPAGFLLYAIIRTIALPEPKEKTA